MEGLTQTTRGAAEHLLGWYNGHAVVWGIDIPWRCAGGGGSAWPG